MAENKCGGSVFHENLCAIGTGRFQGIVVEVRVQNNEFGPKELSKSSPCVLKLISAISANSKSPFHYFAY